VVNWTSGGDTAGSGVYDLIGRDAATLDRGQPEV
jgi:hypothetical protein